MKIERHAIAEMTIEEFAEAHDLTMEIHERPASMWSPNKSNRFYANFKGCEVINGPTLIGEFGNGVTETEAINNYAKEISEKTIVIDAFTPDQLRFEVPRLVHKKAGVE